MAKPSARSRARNRRPGRNAAMRARESRSTRPVWIGVTLVVVVAIALGIALAARGGSGSSAERSSAPAALVSKVTSIPASVISQVGKGTVTSEPKPIDAPALTKDGKPLVFYYGAEYCPYCAAERWAVVAALSRFGTFTDLKLTQSSSIDVFPSTNTFSFYGASFTSKYLAFEAVEVATNKLSGSGNYEKLETPTPEQAQLVATYDAPPYVSGGTGAIPFVDFGGKYVISGATYDPQVLQGKTADEIASALSDPASTTSKAVVGAANTITAAVCSLTHDQPAAACAVPAVKKIESGLG